MIIPTRQLLLILCLGIPLSILPIFHESVGMAAFLCYLLIVLLLAVFEYIVSYSPRHLVCQLSVPEVSYVEDKDKVTLSLYYSGRMETKAYLFIHVEGPAKLEMPDKSIFLKPGNNSFDYELYPLQRGEAKFREIRVRRKGLLGLWWFQSHFQQKAMTRLLPNIRAVGRYALSLVSDPQKRVGVRVEKYRGEGSEFESLREYMPGFDTRTIDWKVSARKANIHCREFRTERNNEVIIALDSGRLMAAELQGIAKLDYAINATLLLSYFAIKSGDRVGLMVFSDTIEKYLAPQAKLSALDEISKACEKISYRFVETNFVISMEYLFTMQKKRSLVIVFTDFVDVISSEMMKDYLGLLSRRHLVVFVAIRDPFIDQSLECMPMDISDMYRQISCYHLKNERFKLFSDLKRMGVHCLDLYPSRISVPVLNHYIEIRRQEMI